jgi:hypothetical protein
MLWPLARCLPRQGLQSLTGHQPDVSEHPVAPSSSRSYLPGEKMSNSAAEVSARTSSEFAEDTILEAFVPSASHINLHELLESWDGDIAEDSNSIVPFIEQRQFLLLGEPRPVYSSALVLLI